MEPLSVTLGMSHPTKSDVLGTLLLAQFNEDYDMRK